jgi:hypothetical protein
MNSRILVHRRITEGGSYISDLTRHLPDWQDESRAAGGFWTGHGTISETMSRLELTDMFQTGLGRIIRREAFGCTGWEGLIYELRLTVAGIQYVRSLTPELWHNRVRVYFTERHGEEMKTDWAQDDASVSQYGECEYIVTLGTASTESANRYLQRHIAEYAWPRTRLAGATVASGAVAASRACGASCPGWLAASRSAGCPAAPVLSARSACPAHPAAPLPAWCSGRSASSAKTA